MKYRIHQEAFKLIAILAIISLVPLFFGSLPLAVFLMILALYTAWFFRYPLKVNLPDNYEDQIICPAWGKVTSVEDVVLKDGTSGRRISIFLNIFNVHLQCFPISGKIESISYSKGLFKNALKPETSQENEKNSLVIQNKRGYHQIDQIAGLIARRIVCWYKEGDEAVTGDYFGLIRFGSRVDLFFPEKFKPCVKVNDKVAGGDILAEFAE